MWVQDSSTHSWAWTPRLMPTLHVSNAEQEVMTTKFWGMETVFLFGKSCGLWRSSCSVD